MNVGLWTLSMAFGGYCIGGVVGNANLPYGASVVQGIYYAGEAAYIGGVIGWATGWFVGIIFSSTAQKG